MHDTGRRTLFTAALLTTTFIAALVGCRTTAGPPDDTALNSAIQRKLAADTAISAEPIQAFVQSGVAFLQGSVSSEAARALAAGDASQIAGVRSVVNQLTVQTGPPQNQTATISSAAAPQDFLPARNLKLSPMIGLRHTPSSAPPQISRNDVPAPRAPVSAALLRKTPAPH